MFDFIIKPVVTEKATSGEKLGKYQFYVRPSATKIAIKQAFKLLYGVDAAKVNVMNTEVKTKLSRSRRATVKRPAYKKVLITTKAKKAVDLSKPKLKV